MIFMKLKQAIGLAALLLAGIVETKIQAAEYSLPVQWNYSTNYNSSQTGFNVYLQPGTGPVQKLTAPMGTPTQVGTNMVFSARLDHLIVGLTNTVWVTAQDKTTSLESVPSNKIVHFTPAMPVPPYNLIVSGPITITIP